MRAENAKLPGDCGLARLGTAHQVEGWFDRTSVAPGEPVRLFSSTTAQTLTVSVFRVGWYDGHGCRLVEHRGPLPGVRQPVPGPAPGTNTIATSWRQTTTFATSSWPAGDYLIRLDDADGWQAYVPLTVRGPAQPGRIVILNAVTTWQAYNAWGGYSLYHGPSGQFTDRARVVSFDRPYDFGDGAADFTGNEQPLVMLAERLGLPVRYATDIDLHADPHLLDGARAVISLGHDEYYSREMRAALTAARDRGVNIAFLGANAVYRRIRLSASPTGPNRTQAGYKIATEDPLYGVDNSRITANWPSPPNADPESSLTGGMYQCNPAHADMTVWNPRHWLLAGTGTATGDRIPGMIGPEYDRVDASVPTPGQIEVLGHSPVTCRDDPDFADVTYYLHGALRCRCLRRRHQRLGVRPQRRLRSRRPRPGAPGLHHPGHGEPAPGLRRRHRRAGAPGGPRRADRLPREGRRGRTLSAAHAVLLVPGSAQATSRRRPPAEAQAGRNNQAGLR
ncbi:N,N-dimethylformamidase beta subunit family domain-containing protein [Parafrankia soli]|uniref:N,N-dimethylformamidase beta subunit family domain-containing protein n=1 Tax=Parafrankia soli TaxID=2599596 RepID=UPI001F516635|nr:N,N-dimethylformamidase beta subunit family domain-containing protein [Parafrankia soli]